MVMSASTTITAIDVLVLFTITGAGTRGHVVTGTGVSVLFSAKLDTITCEEIDAAIKLMQNCHINNT